jgi:hypothetical protein
LLFILGSCLFATPKATGKLNNGKIIIELFSRLYPIFDMLTLQYQIALFVIGGVLFWFLYLIGDGISTMLWGKAVHVKTSEIKNKSN